MTTYTSEALLREVRDLYGVLPPPRGVVHVVSATRTADGRLHVIAIGPHAPRSATDFFVLQLFRARAAAVLSTAQILRAEPQLSLAFAGPWAQALAAHRTQLLGEEPLACAILTQSGGVPAQHPLFRDPVQKLVFTMPERAAELSRRLGSEVEVLGEADLTARLALQRLAERGACSISVEAGPSTASTLYGAEPCVDELWLSRVDIPSLDPRAVGTALPPDELLFAGLTLASSVSRAEQSGTWHFQRYVR